MLSLSAAASGHGCVRGQLGPQANEHGRKLKRWRLQCSGWFVAEPHKGRNTEERMRRNYK
jgi:hypothetical protein